jgi:predicted nucleotidyltransferase
MYILHSTHLKFLDSMLDAEVDFLLIGGYAVIFHGYIRVTADMDIWLKPTNENKQKLLTAFKNVELHPDDIKQLGETFDFTSIVVFHFGMPPERIDFLTKVPGVNFDDAFAKKEFMNINGRDVPVLRLDDLIVAKLLAGRPQDKADVEMLQQINKLSKK